MGLLVSSITAFNSSPIGARIASSPATPNLDENQIRPEGAGFASARVAITLSPGRRRVSSDVLIHLPKKQIPLDERLLHLNKEWIPGPWTPAFCEEKKRVPAIRNIQVSPHIPKNSQLRMQTKQLPVIPHTLFPRPSIKISDPQDYSRHLWKLGSRWRPRVHQGWFGASGILDQSRSTAICNLAIERRGVCVSSASQISKSKSIRYRTRSMRSRSNASCWRSSRVTGFNSTPSHSLKDFYDEQSDLLLKLGDVIDEDRLFVCGDFNFGGDNSTSIGLDLRNLLDIHTMHQFVTTATSHQGAGDGRQSRFEPHLAAIRSPDSWRLRSPSRHVISGYANAATT